MSAVADLAAGSRTIGLVVWSKSRGYAGVCDDGSQVEPIGGVVVEVLDCPDPETGELRRRYRVLDPERIRPRLTWHVVDEDDVDPYTAEPASAATVVKVIRRLCEEVAMRERYRHRTGRFDPDHATLIAYAYRLAGVL